MAKKKLFKTKKLGKEIMPAIGQTASATAGFTVGKIVENKIVEKKPEAKKIIGPAAFILGTALTAVVDEGNTAGKYIKSAGIGLAASGGYSAITTNVPEETQRKIGLSGIGASNTANGSEDDEDVFDKLAQEAEQEVETELNNGLPEPEEEPYKEVDTEEPVSMGKAPDNEIDAIVDNLID